MIRCLSLLITLLIAITLSANTIIVRNSGELEKANQAAKPGDLVILKNGEWNNITITLTCAGTKEKPITFKAETAGKVLVTGHSKLKIGGSFIIVEGLHFANGYSGEEPVISFRVSKNQLANNCRITSCVVDDFNNIKRSDENNWVLFYGKNNRLDHCGFFNKKNLGVLLAVILDDEGSRENFHSIDHNYFGIRLPLASNGGEIIRVGVSQHCQFNSNTQITDNYFEYCDGETEIVSIKSGSNVVRNNLFKECQGSVVLRHGDNNLVENNVFIGNDKEGTGGVRVINKGQWVVNNFFYKCRGTGFRAPLTIMNGIPNSPAHRYVQVQDAVIANNTFFNCAFAAFCDGSDTERTLPPANVYLVNNSFVNSRDKNIFRAYDDIGGFHFAGNAVSREVEQQTGAGFERTPFTSQKADHIPFPIAPGTPNNSISDSLQRVAIKKLNHPLKNKPGFSDLASLKKIMANAAFAGAKWFRYAKKKPTTATISCKSSSELRAALTSKAADQVIIKLTSSVYHLTDPLIVRKNTEITPGGKQQIRFKWPEGEGTPSGKNMLFEVKGGATLKLTNLNFDFGGYENAFRDFIRTDTSRSSQRSNIIIRGCTFRHIQTTGGHFLFASKSAISDSIVVSGNVFDNNKCGLFAFTAETDKKGYYNVERLVITGNRISDHEGAVLHMLRGGNDESTMGPRLFFTGNQLSDCHVAESDDLLRLVGTQFSSITKNRFNDCSPGSVLLRYEDFVRARHILDDNEIKDSGRLVTNKYVEGKQLNSQ